MWSQFEERSRAPGKRTVVRRILAAGLVSLGVSGCGFEPPNAVPFNPPAEYLAWFAATEKCSELQGDFAKIQWFEVPGRSFACPTGECVARWEPGPRIYLADFWIGHEMVARHEMLHSLIGESGHPNPPFGLGCPLTWDTWPTRHTGSSSPPIQID